MEKQFQEQQNKVIDFNSKYLAKGYRAFIAPIEWGAWNQIMQRFIIHGIQPPPDYYKVFIESLEPFEVYVISQQDLATMAVGGTIVRTPLSYYEKEFIPKW